MNEIMKRKVQFKEELEKLTKAELKQTRSRVSKYLESATLSILGLEKKYNGDFEIDHCNGRNSVLIDAFRDLAKTEANRIAQNYKPNKEELAVFEEAFKRELRSQFGYIIRDVAKGRAQQLANEVMSKIKIDVDKILAEELGGETNKAIEF